MYEEHKTTEHARNSHGQVDIPRKHRKKNPVSAFLGYAAVTMALALTVTALLLHGSMQNNAASLKKIQELEQRQEIMSYSAEREFIEPPRQLEPHGQSSRVQPTRQVQQPEPAEIHPEPVEIHGAIEPESQVEKHDCATGQC